MSIMMFRDFLRLQRWERAVLKRDFQGDGMFTRAFRMIPWSGVAMFVFIMLFFGIDLGAGVTQTASQLREKKNEAQATIELEKVKARQWSVEQVKNFREGEGEVPKASWTEGGPRSIA
ncbi:hypothetical protein AGDE_01534 [Angomonas deanei]|uniref:Uncharacterized protein n=1 Tax=Angomonas deanei TaxID=59799 RepID=S9VB78_9TRYP|nr:hypothetical protein AGDE_03741 [Angomonas deanei]EPY42083.1 hypothetical protein AGDE_01840 [Angomonas deanei]EPY42389.1 hypothetical protein AGDE_01534 [Angomonas deanei]CAD2216011.1 hypothetical protein, conserved [Angomonas deanei]|eukprot:EPY40187.1 hypothetical protein AGDE_03741 [Angomonas deanei]